MSTTGAITATELANRLGVTTRTVQRWVRDQRVEHWRMGRTIRFLPRQVEAIEARHANGVRERRPEVDVPNPVYQPLGRVVPIRPSDAA